MAELNDRIVPLDELDDFEVAEGDPDVRGWDVISADGRKIGEVEQLLVDTAAMKVRYLDVDVDDELMESDNDERHILIPIGYARLDEDDDHVVVDQLQSSQISTLPVYDHRPLTRDYETSVRQSFETGYTGASTGAVAPTTEPTESMPSTDTAAKDDFYAHDLYNDNRFYGSRRKDAEGERRLTLSEEQLDVGKREVRAGEVRIDKDVETRHVQRDVPVQHEEVIVERRPAEPGMGANARIEEGEIHVPVTQEELVVQKRTVPKEELVVKKRTVTENEPVEADLRSQRAEVHEEGDFRMDRKDRENLR
jgi:uncharacterized protein (TIGR02271 family)